MKCRVSIIVPVYNVEKYLEECLDSLVNQTLKDIEIICINDASPDNSLNILKDYKKKYPKLIKVIDLKKNVCLGGARNKGLDIARGEYISFVDSDDYVDANMCEKLYNHANKHEADIVQFNYVEFRDNKKSKKIIDTDIDLFESGNLVVSKEEFIGETHDYMCFRFYKKHLWSKVRYPEGVTYEDQATFLLLAVLSNKFIKLDESLYFYRRRAKSITATRSRFFTQIDGIRFMVEQSKKLGVYDKYHQIINERCVKIFLGIWDAVYSTRYNYERDFVDRVQSCEQKLSQLVPNYKNMLLNMKMSATKKRMLELYFSHPWLYKWILNIKYVIKRIYYFKFFK
jgi:glycosyltransferase involved in cell wall biosynthesis